LSLQLTRQFCRVGCARHANRCSVRFDSLKARIISLLGIYPFTYYLARQPEPRPESFKAGEAAFPASAAARYPSRMAENSDLPKPEAATDSIQKRQPTILRILAGLVAVVMLAGTAVSLVEMSGWADIRDAFLFTLLGYGFGGYALGYIAPRWHRKK
jgi:hypothetical protein